MLEYIRGKQDDRSANTWSVIARIAHGWSVGYKADQPAVGGGLCGTSTRSGKHNQRKARRAFPTAQRERLLPPSTLEHHARASQQPTPWSCPGRLRNGGQDHSPRGPVLRGNRSAFPIAGDTGTVAKGGHECVKRFLFMEPYG